MLGKLLERVRETSPRVHCITNYVTANDCANLLLAVGASPVMADDPQEAEEIASLCGAVVLNLGTLSAHRLEAMRLAGRTANALGRPVVLDPVGVTASRMRREAASALLAEIRFAVIRGNASEIRALAGERYAACGVDAADGVSDGNIGELAAMGKALSAQTGAVIALTGATDVISDADRAVCVHNGHPLMRCVTGTGCQLSALMGAFAAANPQEIFCAAAAAACMMGLCGEIAYGLLAPQEGSATYRNRMIDAAQRMTAGALREGARYESR